MQFRESPGFVDCKYSLKELFFAAMSKQCPVECVFVGGDDDVETNSL